MSAIQYNKDVNFNQIQVKNLNVICFCAVINVKSMMEESVFLSYRLMYVMFLDMVPGITLAADKGHGEDRQHHIQKHCIH